MRLRWSDGWCKVFVVDDFICYYIRVLNWRGVLWESIKIFVGWIVIGKVVERVFWFLNWVEVFFDSYELFFWCSLGLYGFDRDLGVMVGVMIF